MRNFQDTFETCKRSFITAFSICMTIASQVFKQGDSSSRLKIDGCFFQQNYMAKYEMVFALTQKNVSS